MNIVSMGMKYLGPMVVTQVASMLGIKSPMVTKMIMAALPTILAGLSGKAASGGAGAIMDMFSGSKAQSPDDFAKSLEAGNVTDLANSGMGSLKDLLGGNQADALTKALSDYSGADAGAAGSLLGMLAPAALSSVQGQVEEQGLDANGLIEMLTGQKQNIADAMPAGFADHVQGSGLLDAIADEVPAAAPAPAPAAAPAAATPRPVEASSGGGGGLMKWLIPLVIIAGLAWYFLGGKSDDMAEMAGETMMVGEENVGEKFGTTIEGLTATLGGITDADTATAALPDLENFSTEIGSLSDLAGQLPEAGQSAFGGIVATAISTLEPMIASAVEASGAGGVLQPILDGIMEKLKGMAG
jgi:hypothetical protein